MATLMFVKKLISYQLTFYSKGFEKQVRKKGNKRNVKYEVKTRDLCPVSINGLRQ